MKKKFLAVFILAMVMALAAMCAVLTACSDKEEYPAWNVSAEGSNVTAIFTDNGNYGYILTVEGSGAMQSYPSAADTPWYGKSGRITQLVIKDGVTNIGDNAFTYCYYANTVILPASVTAVGSNAFPAGTKVYCYAADVTVGEGTTVYTYSEAQPTVGGNFWHNANGSPAVWPYVVTSAQKILFIGNSYTFYNDMPTLFENIATAAGAEVTVEKITAGSQSLKNWANPKTDDGARVEAALTASSDYDIIVLQEKSTSPVNDDYRYFVSGAKALAARINETQENCRIFLYETWGSPAYAGSYGGSVQEMESRLRSAYDTVAEKIGATVSYAGKAFTYTYENHTDINLYNADDKNHPSYEGSYLAACVHATSLLGLNVKNSTYNGTLDEVTAATLREVGYSVAVGADLPEITYDMQIAVYSRYTAASTITNLVAAFKEDYAAKNGGEVPKIKCSLLGADKTAVAAFGELVNSGSYDIVFATGNNINSDGGVSVIAKKSYSVVDSVYPDGGTRYISRLTENETAVAFYNFIDTDAAKVILNPDYVPEIVNEITVSFVVDGSAYGTPVVLSSAGSAVAQAIPSLPEKTGLSPIGWALTENEVENEPLYSGNVTYATFASVAKDGKVTLYARYVSDGTTVITVNIAVFKRYVNESTIISLTAAFKESYSLNEDEILKVTYDMLGDGSTGAKDFGDLVNAGAYNITFGSGGNVDSTGGVTIVAKKDVTLDSYSGIRTVAYLTEDEATEAFYNFLDTSAAKKIMNSAYVTEAEADKIVITFMNGDSQYGGETLTVSNATDAEKIKLPVIDNPDFKGWTVPDSETLLNGSIGYADIESLSTNGTLTLYASYVGYDVVIAIHSSASASSVYITAAEIELLQTAFENYLSENGYNDVKIDWHVVTDKNGNGFASDVNDYGTVDVMVGGNNMDTSTPKITLNTQYKKTDVKEGMFANTSRKVGIIDGKEANIYAQLFYQFMTPEAEGGTNE